MIVSGTLKTTEIQSRRLNIVAAMDYNDKTIIKLPDGKWYYWEQDVIQADVNGGPIQQLINRLKGGGRP